MRVPRLTPSTGLAAVWLIWAAVIVLWREAPFAMTFDDAWYYFEIGRNIASGHGSTFDRLNSTNGYHPLWMGVCVVVYAVGLDGLAAVRVLLLGQLSCWCLAAWLVLRRFATTTASLVAGLMLAANPFTLKVFVNGLEAGLVALVGAVLLDRLAPTDGAWIGSSTSRWWQAGSGVLLGLAILARTDAVLLAGCVVVWCVPVLRSLGWRRWCVQLLTVLAPAGVGLAFAAGVNLWAGGSATQVSGDLKRLPLTAGRAVVLVLFAGAAIGLLLAGWRRVGSSGRFATFSDTVGTSAWYGAFGVLAAGYYVVLQVQQWLWYFAPLGLFGIVAFVSVVRDLDGGIRADIATGAASARSGRLAAGLLGLPLAAGLVLGVASVADPELRSIQLANERAGRWISASREVPADAVLASWDAGVLGYFTEQRVVNLDGVVNSFAYLEAWRLGDRASFLADQDVAWLVNHGPDVDGRDPELEALAPELLGPDRVQGLVHVRRWPFRYSGTTTSSGDYRSIGRMAVHLYRVRAT